MNPFINGNCFPLLTFEALIKWLQIREISAIHLQNDFLSYILASISLLGLHTQINNDIKHPGRVSSQCFPTFPLSQLSSYDVVPSLTIITTLALFNYIPSERLLYTTTQTPLTYFTTHYSINASQSYSHRQTQSALLIYSHSTRSTSITPSAHTRRCRSEPAGFPHPK